MQFFHHFFKVQFNVIHDNLYSFCFPLFTCATVQGVKINEKLQQSQVSPQQASMTFLPGETKMMDVEVFAPTKGPLDLYILMDFSNSMQDDLDNLKKMGNELGEQIWIVEIC